MIDRPYPELHRRRLKVLVISHELTLTGAPRLALEAFRALRNLTELRTVSRSGGGLEAAFRELGPVEVLDQLPERLRRPGGSVVPNGIARLRAPVVGIVERQWRPDLVLVNSVAAITLLPRLRLGRFPTVLYVHELEAALARLGDRHRELLSALPDRYLAVSRAVADDLTRAHRIPVDRLAVVPPIIDLDRIDKLAAAPLDPEPPREGERPFLVGGAGNPHWTKGIELWLLMARALLDRLGEGSVRFEWVGVRDNHAATEVRAMVRKLGLQPNVDLVAETANPYPYFRRFDVFAMTSWEESASLVVLENMALEIPVVSFMGALGPREQLGDTGVVIEQFSPMAMTDAIAALLAEPETRERIGLREHARVAEVNAPGRIAGHLFRELSETARSAGA